MATDDAIDRLYQLGLDTFIAERNALAKSLRDADIKALEKPSLPAWAVNQVYWHRRPVFERLVTAAEVTRAAHLQALAGKAADIRAAESEHRAAIREAVAAARAALDGAGHLVTPGTLEAVTRTLEALPSSEASGRLVRPLSPAGFEALAGLAAAPARPVLRVVASRAADARAEASRDAAQRATQEAEARAERDARVARELEERAAGRRAAEQAIAAATADLQRTATAVAQAEQALLVCQAERVAALAALVRAKRDLDSA